MVKVYLRGHDNYYGIADILRLFGGNIREERENGYVSCDLGFDLEIISEILPDGTTAAYKKGGTPVPCDLPAIPANRSVKRDLYILLSKITNMRYPWGCLTGIRPTLVAGEDNDPGLMSAKYLVRKDKAELALETAMTEGRILGKRGEETLNIYIGVPFCPSRCEYCSFISNDAVKHMKLLEPYAASVIEEIRTVAPRIKRRVASLYIGGGTPTVFSEELFGRFIGSVTELLPVDSETEFTVEAGRADTITQVKLDLMRKAGATRICINPQTMNSGTLARLHRNHTAEDTVRAYEQAVGAGFESINMDLIAGLKYESDEDFINSINTVISLKPSDITIHTLYKKRRAEMTRETVLSRDRGDTDKAVGEGYTLLYQNGYHPYYMYRQKDTGHGLENTGFTKGDGCYYNVAMMSDKRDVLSFGAGGMSKRIFDGGRLERCSCIKDVTGYITSVSEMAEKKIGFFEL